MNSKTRIVIIGGGFAGTATALNLEQTYRRDPSVEITLIDSENFFTFTPLLAEVPSGSIQPKHIVFPLRALLKQTKVKQAEVKSMATAAIAIPSANLRHRTLFPFFDAAAP